MKNISLGTSKENYIDPRITMVFIKKYKINPNLNYGNKINFQQIEKNYDALTNKTINGLTPETLNNGFFNKNK